MKSKMLNLFLVCILISISLTEANAQWTKLTKHPLFDVAVNVGTGIVSDLILNFLKKEGISAKEIESQRRRIADFENRLDRIEAPRDYPSRSEFNDLKRAVDDLRSTYDKLSERLEGEVDAAGGEIGEFKRKVSDRVYALSASIQGVQNSFYNYSSNSATFSIHNVLGPYQWIENVDIYLNGHYAGKLLVNAYYPRSSLKINLDKEGRFSYAIEAQAIFFDQFGQFYTDQTRGTGVINVSSGSNFIVTLVPYEGPKLTQIQ